MSQKKSYFFFASKKININPINTSGIYYKKHTLLINQVNGRMGFSSDSKNLVKCSELLVPGLQRTIFYIIDDQKTGAVSKVVISSRNLLPDQDTSKSLENLTVIIVKTRCK